MPENTRRRFPLAAGAACLAAALALPTGAAGALTASPDLARGAAAPAQPTPTPPGPETTAGEGTPTEDPTTREDTPTEDTPTGGTTTGEDSPSGTGEATPLPTPTTPAEAKDEVDELSGDPGTPDEVKGYLNELAALLDEAVTGPAPVQKAAVEVSTSVILTVEALKAPRTSAADKAVLSDCVEELTASAKVIVDVRVSVTVRQALARVSVHVRVTVQALRAPKVPPKTRTALRGAVQEQTAVLVAVRGSGSSRVEKKQLANVTAPIETVSRIVVNGRTPTAVKEQAHQVLTRLTLTVRTVRETEQGPTAKWRACDRALSGLNASTATTIPQQCEGGLRG
ncbi:hypothetical protein ACIF8T_02095 [Streptomyces sp. NPDC085946]|uniref:hypothetical protein n=1 Tax=Streptomyces sp. NPDC085946 TaxID=3365744 RepID=UPI0037D3E521